MATKANMIIASPEARTATEIFVITPNNLSNGNFILNITEGATVDDTLTVSFQTYDPASKLWLTILTSAALEAIAITVFSIGNIVSAAANLSVVNFLPRTFRIVATKNTATAITYSIGANLSD